MELIRGFHNIQQRQKGCVATIGAFDGVHLGHQKVLEQLVNKGVELGLPTVVVVFEPLPREYFAPQDAPPRIMSFRERFRVLEEMGVDFVMRIRFTSAFSGIGPVEFIQKLFVDGLDVKSLIVGDDLRFGRGRSGGYELLKSAGMVYGFEVVPTATCKKGEERVSSTRIREVLAASEFDEAERLLGRPYSISGRVVVGQQLGRQLGVPTANLQLRRLRSPLEGVFAVEVKGVGDTLLRGVANVGTRPTVDNLPRAILEVHILDFSGDLYGRNIEVIFRKKLRDEVRFENIDALKQQIYKDIDEARAVFSKNESAEHYSAKNSET